MAEQEGNGKGQTCQSTIAERILEKVGLAGEQNDRVNKQDLDVYGDSNLSNQLRRHEKNLTPIPTKSASGEKYCWHSRDALVEVADMGRKYREKVVIVHSDTEPRSIKSCFTLGR